MLIFFSNFLLPYSLNELECGGYITGTGGSLLSPNYPDDYDPNTFCDWFLTAQNGGRIAIIIYDLDTEYGRLNK